MRYAHLPRLLSIAILVIALAVSGLLGSDVEAQGGIRLRQPFAGTYRLTAYVIGHKLSLFRVCQIEQSR